MVAFLLLSLLALGNMGILSIAVFVASRACLFMATVRLLLIYLLMFVN